MGKLILFLAAFLSSSFFLAAQNDIYPCTPGPGGGSSFCEEICNQCSLDGFSGSNDGYFQSIAVDFCGTLENAQWFGFIAGQPNAAFTLTASNCLDGHGMQMALYGACDDPFIVCGEGEVDGADLPITINATLTTGQQYFLLIDGFAGDVCNFTLDVHPANAIYSPPIGNAGAVQGPGEMCPGATFTFNTPSVAGAGGYVWDGPPGTLVNGEPVPFTVPAPEGISVEITIGDVGGDIGVQPVNGCNTGTPAAAAVAILGDEYRPVLALDSVAGLSCVSDLTTLDVDVQPAGQYGYEWTTSDGHLVSGENTASPNIDSVGTYNVIVRNVTNGCFSADSVRVGTPLVPEGADLAVQNVRCYGEANGAIAIREVLGGTDPFLTSLNDMPLSTAAQYEFLPTGDYLLTIEGADGCRWDTLLQVAQPDELLLDLGPDTTIHLGQAIQLWKDDALNYPERRQDAFVTPDILQPMLCDSCWYPALASFRYKVLVLDSSGCQVADERVVTVDKERFVFIPNAFHPDESGDGNSEFRIFGGEDVDHVASLQIFDYWGALVFETYDFVPNDTAPGWNGTARGDKLSPGVFLYAAEVVFKDGEKKLYRGDVALVR